MSSASVAMVSEFLVAACAPRENHPSGTLERADAILAERPDVASGDIYTVAVLGDADAVCRFLAADAALATTTGGPYEWDALTYLCFSRYLRLRAHDGFVRAAESLLDAGADPDTGFFEPEHAPAATFESALYGAAGVAHHPDLTRLLLERGADPNRGGEVAYHAPEGFDDQAMHLVVLSGRVSTDGLTTMLHRKLDWTSLDGVRWLLEHGADSNALSGWGDRALHHSLGRDNALTLLEVLLDFGADPTLTAGPRAGGASAVAMAARAGRADALELFGRRGFAVELKGDDEFYAALSRGRQAEVAAFVAAEPGIVERLEAGAPATVATLAGAGNTVAVALALDFGFPLSDDALSVAVWRGRVDTVRLLIGRGAPVSDDVVALAERALTEMSEWTPHHSREILDALREAS